MKPRTIYYTRVSVPLMAFIVAIFAIPLALSLMVGNTTDIIIGVATCASMLALIVALVFSTRYVIDGNRLKIYVLFWASSIDINSITRIEPSRCLLSSPAASLNRIALHHGKRYITYISPRHQDDFITHLKSINENIETV